MKRIIEKVLSGNGENHLLPFFWQHGEDEITLRKYMAVIQEGNCDAVCIESRPHPDFCGEKWWRDMDIILDEARKRKMKVWILDDKRFPTGYAAGALEKCDQSLCRQSLIAQTMPCPNTGELFTLNLDDIHIPDWEPNQMELHETPPEKMRKFHDDSLLAIVAVKTKGTSLDDICNLTPSRNDKEIYFSVPEGIWKIYIMHRTRNRGPHRNYINMMNTKSCRLLLDAVYEPHFKRYAADFGTTIAGFFSDEPEIGNWHLYSFGERMYEMEDQAWSETVETALEKKWGSDYVRYLPLLWEQDFADDLKAATRYTYMDVVTRLVESSFSQQLGKWCSDHGVMYIGHLIEDNNQHTRTGSGLGHYFRGISGQDMAGIDDIGNQVKLQGEELAPGGGGVMRDGEFYHYVLGKLASSAAAIDPKKQGKAMCEIFGAYGWGEGVQLEKYLIDHFLVRGINYFVPHAFSPKEYPDPDCPPHFYANGHNPQYRHFGKLMKYTNRMCNLLSGGKAEVPVAMLYSAEAEWTGNVMHLQKPARELYDRQMDYYFVPSDIFTDEKYLTELGTTLIVNQQEFKVLIVPEYQFITTEAANAIARLSQKGFPVIFINQMPAGICDGSNDILQDLRDCLVIPLSSLGEELEKNNISNVRIDPADKQLRVLHYQTDSDCYLLVNEGVKSYTGTIHVPSSGNCFAYMGWENQTQALCAKPEKGGTCISITVEPNKSVLIVFGEDNWSNTNRINGGQDIFDEVDWNSKWSRSYCRSIDYPHFNKEQMINLPDTLGQEEPEFSGFIRYEKVLDCENSGKQSVLQITNAAEGVEVFVNDVSAGIQIVPPYRYDLTELLQKGVNTVRIEVATTLMRERWPDMIPVLQRFGMSTAIPDIPTGITGTVQLFMERD